LFPYEHPRPIQSAALDAVAIIFDPYKCSPILEAPAEAGKSALVFNAARNAGTLDEFGDEEFEPGAYEDAKAGFFESTRAVTSCTYFLRARQAQKRRVLILDEGHKWNW
jgi:hypothetical protein